MWLCGRRDIGWTRADLLSFSRNTPGRANVRIGAISGFRTAPDRRDTREVTARPFRRQAFSVSETGTPMKFRLPVHQRKTAIHHPYSKWSDLQKPNTKLIHLKHSMFYVNIIVNCRSATGNHCLQIASISRLLLHQVGIITPTVLLLRQKSWKNTSLNFFSLPDSFVKLNELF